MKVNLDLSSPSGEKVAYANTVVVVFGKWRSFWKWTTDRQQGYAMGGSAILHKAKFLVLIGGTRDVLGCDLEFLYVWHAGMTTTCTLSRSWTPNS